MANSGLRTTILVLTIILTGCTSFAAQASNTETPRPTLGPNPSATPTLSQGQMPSAEFRNHLTNLVLQMTPLVSRIADAIEARDDGKLALAADELYTLMSADEDWQRANAEAILGNCYDDAAESYSNGFVWMSGGATQIGEYIRTGDREKLGYGVSLIQDGSRDFQAAAVRLQQVNC